MKWDLGVIRKLNEADFDILSLAYHDGFKILKEILSLFQYRVESFFKFFVIDVPLGKAKHHVILV